MKGTERWEGMTERRKKDSSLSQNNSTRSIFSLSLLVQSPFVQRSKWLDLIYDTVLYYAPAGIINYSLGTVYILGPCTSNKFDQNNQSMQCKLLPLLWTVRN